MKDITRLITMGRTHLERESADARTINSPIYNGSTVLFKDYAELAKANAGEHAGPTYGTDRLPNQREFEEALRRFEGGSLTRAFQSGLSAITHSLQAFTETGAHILVCENVYGPTAAFCRKVLTKYQVEVSFLPAAIGSDIERYLKPNTKVIFLESPGSNTFEIQDIRAITAIAGARNILTMLDNTWATPLYLKPFELGIDVSIQSVTKYISGHSDVLLGAVTVNEKWADAFESYYRVLEIFAPPQDCSLALRGLRTLRVRLRQHELSALKVARWLEEQRMVERVIHPALPSHPQHHLWKRDFSGSSGLFSFILDDSVPEHGVAEFINRLEVFGIGYSWGGFKSLVTVGRYQRSGSDFTGKTVVRLNIGLEDEEDLISDLQRAFEVLT